MNRPKENIQLREKMSSLMLETYFAMRRANPDAHKAEVENETTKLMQEWIKECSGNIL